MDSSGNELYASHMTGSDGVPSFTLFGETGEFPDIVHCEAFVDRAANHDWVITPHRHPQMSQLFVISQGSARVRIDGERLALESGAFLFMPPLVVHGFEFTRGAEGHVISMPNIVRQAMRPTSDALARRLAHPFIGRTSDDLVAAIDALRTAFKSAGAFRTERLVSLANAILAIIGEIRAEQRVDPEDAPPSDRRMARFQELIAAKATEGWRPGDYAQAMNITPGHLNRICRTATGRSASHHIECAVMTEARRMLAFTQMPIAEIAYRLQFHDPAHFSRRFRNQCGEPPSAYRSRFNEAKEGV